MKRYGQTWIEFMVALAIIAMLAAIIIPVIVKVKRGLPPNELTVTTNGWLNSTVAKVRVEGHDYLVFEHGVVHSATCPCKTQ